jgi:hypothetical protein
MRVDTDDVWRRVAGLTGAMVIMHILAPPCSNERQPTAWS